jgi:hypothetical protein
MRTMTSLTLSDDPKSRRSFQQLPAMDEWQTLNTVKCINIFDAYCVQVSFRVSWIVWNRYHWQGIFVIQHDKRTF